MLIVLEPAYVNEGKGRQGDRGPLI